VPVGSTLIIQMTLLAYLFAQQASLVRAFNDPGDYPIGISDPDHFPLLLQRDHTIEFDPRVRKRRAFTRRVHATGEIEYWVHIDYTAYRKAFWRHLSTMHAVPEAEITSGWHADHLLSKAYARKFGVQYVRMCLLARRQNLDYGRKFERNMLAIQQSSRSVFLLDYLCAMKALGILIPKDRADYEARKSSIAQELSKKGVVFPDKRGAEFELDAYFKWWDVIK
jgi:hypothetical protein